MYWWKRWGCFNVCTCLHCILSHWNQVDLPSKESGLKYCIGCIENLGFIFISGSHLLLESSFLSSETGRIISTFWEISQVSFRFYIQSTIVSFQGGWTFCFCCINVSLLVQWRQDSPLCFSLSSWSYSITSPCTPSSVW